MATDSGATMPRACAWFSLSLSYVLMGCGFFYSFLLLNMLRNSPGLYYVLLMLLTLGPFAPLLWSVGMYLLEWATVSRAGDRLWGTRARRCMGLALLLASYCLACWSGLFCTAELLSLQLGIFHVDANHLMLASWCLASSALTVLFLKMALNCLGHGDFPEAESSPRKALAFGLLFPGAAQVYQRRWLPAGFFLFAPWTGALAGLLLASILGGLVKIYPTFKPWLARPIAVLGVLIMLAPLGIPMVWLGSMVEGFRYARRRAATSPRTAPYWQAPLVGLPLLLSLFFPALVLFYQLLSTLGSVIPAFQSH